MLHQAEHNNMHSSAVVGLSPCSMTGGMPSAEVCVEYPCMHNGCGCTHPEFIALHEHASKHKSTLGVTEIGGVVASAS